VKIILEIISYNDISQIILDENITYLRLIDIILLISSFFKPCYISTLFTETHIKKAPSTMLRGLLGIER